MNKKEVRHKLILSLISEKKINTQQELQSELLKNGVVVTQATLSRDIKELHLIKTSGKHSQYEVHKISPTHWEERLRFYMEDALVMLKPVQNQVILKTLPGLAQSFGSILDSMQLVELQQQFVVMIPVLLFVKIRKQHLNVLTIYASILLCSFSAMNKIY